MNCMQQSLYSGSFTIITCFLLQPLVQCSCTINMQFFATVFIHVPPVVHKRQFNPVSKEAYFTASHQDGSQQHIYLYTFHMLYKQKSLTLFSRRHTTHHHIRMFHNYDTLFVHSLLLCTHKCLTLGTIRQHSYYINITHLIKMVQLQFLYLVLLQNEYTCMQFSAATSVLRKFAV